MESTADFEVGLMAAYTELEKEHRLSRHDRHVFAKLKHHRERAIERIHKRVREKYVTETGILDRVRAIDWTKAKEWLKANWVHIVQIILTIVFLFL